MMDGYGWGTSGWGPGFGIVLMILFWGLIILGIVAMAIVKWFAGKSPPKSARQILDERYARGEIEREEYEQKKRDLEP